MENSILYLNRPVTRYETLIHKSCLYITNSFYSGFPHASHPARKSDIPFTRQTSPFNNSTYLNISRRNNFKAFSNRSFNIHGTYKVNISHTIIEVSIYSKDRYYIELPLGKSQMPICRGKQRKAVFRNISSLAHREAIIPSQLCRNRNTPYCHSAMTFSGYRFCGEKLVF